MKFQFNRMNIRKIGELERYTIISHTLFSPWIDKVYQIELSFHKCFDQANPKLSMFQNLTEHGVSLQSFLSILSFLDAEH